jgi:putative spermidine/putrescine transport system substrate-binding protein
MKLLHDFSLDSISSCIKVLGIAVAMGALVGTAQAQQQPGPTLRIALQGGISKDVNIRYVIDRFMRNTGVTMEYVEGNPPEHVQKLLASKGRAAPFDIVILDDHTQRTAIDEGTVLKIDPNIVTNLKFLQEEAINKEGYGPAYMFWSWGLFYNAKAFRDAGIPEPTSWEDLWNPKLAGKVAIGDVSGPGGMDFIVTANRLAGGTDDNLLPGIEKIGKLDVHSYFSSSNDLRVKFLSGEVWAAPWNNGRSWDMIDSGFEGKFIYPKEGGHLHTTTVDVVATSEHPKEAQMYINYVLDPLSQVSRLFENPFGPVNKTIDPIMDAYPDLAKRVPSKADFTGTGHFTPVDWPAVSDQRAEVVDAWNRVVKSR